MELDVLTAPTDLLAALSVPVYTTDPEGRLTFYNDAAAEFWGYRPELGATRWCGSWKLYWPDGTPLAPEDCPMGMTLRNGEAVRGAEAIAERPDGTTIPFRPFPSLLRDPQGRVTGGINVLIDLTEEKRNAIATERLAAIVSSSDDAIVGKTLDGTITFWNQAAARIFGYSADEMIGQSILKIIPPDLRHQKEDILDRLRRGERIEHFDTVRLTRDGRRIDVSLTVSPIRDGRGRIIGASKVARDISDRKRHEAMQLLLFAELNHRVKNTLATIQSIASLSLRRAASPNDFVRSFNGRVQALAKAHDLLVKGNLSGADVNKLVRDQVTLGPAESRITFSGPPVKLDPRTAVQMALVLHEMATNAHKHGALSVPDGRLAIRWHLPAGVTRQLHIEWVESGLPDLRPPTMRGFGTTLIERSLDSLGGRAVLHYGAEGLSCDVTVPLPDTGVQAPENDKPATRPSHAAPASGNDLNGRRVLVVEDETLVALDIQEQLTAAGAIVVGPAASVGQALKLVRDACIDVALLDGNLGGHPVDEVAMALRLKNIPFAFATGYGAESLPPTFRDARILTKPFSEDQVVSVVAGLLAEQAESESAA